jgi:hypothetical protein
LEKVGQIAVARVGIPQARPLLLDAKLSSLGIEFGIGTGGQTVFTPRARFDDNRGLLEHVSRSDMDLIASRLAESATYALVGDDHRCQESDIFFGFGEGVLLTADAHELDGIVSGAMAFIDTQLTLFALCEGKTCGFVDNRQSHSREAFLF